MSRWRDDDYMPEMDHHPTCPGGCNELADECRCPRPAPLGSMRVTPAVKTMAVNFPIYAVDQRHVDAADLLGIDPDSADEWLAAYHAEVPAIRCPHYWVDTGTNLLCQMCGDERG